ncbi:hypothetical protein BABINDRAFT_38645 [Babjeviella inositovora NRRL Y-12698]|uniref:Pre-rRNA-processing protein TSR2 n=1 Tax=Babjeviella inositovora NRRL Y-12698 TaxID=984486 RepID=A0A1E3QMA9_9ASCO|nr:uncharacterized protein BABINDRAFT_38645 [Babjeviella inositovora NRRL Y-12698]ODQ78836.1 hypothetical protein BABINDRAFT_38645 [Babjeviella inositovora NRRL Y-12698]
MTTTINIDETDFVTADAQRKTLRFSDEKQQARFELGVCMAIYRWDSLAIAVQNSWGGADSAEKRDWLAGIVAELFDGQTVDVGSIEETLLYGMLDEFDTNVDDDSALPIAALILQIYRECEVQNYATVEDLYKKWEEREKSGKNKQQVHVHIEEDPNNPDESDESDEEEHEHKEEMMDVDDEPKGPIVDDDGFELVQPKGKGRRR